MAWYTNRLTTIDSVYMEMNLNEEIGRIEKYINRYLDGVNDVIKGAAVKISKNHRNIGKSIESLHKKNPKLPTMKLSWLGAEDRYMNLSEIDQDLISDIDEHLIRRAISEPWTMVLGGDENYEEGVPAVFSVNSGNGKYLGSFLLLLDITSVKQALYDAMHIDKHPELSYAVFCKDGVILSSASKEQDHYLRKVIAQRIAEYDQIVMDSTISLFDMEHSYQIKKLSILGDDYKIIMMINHKIAFKNFISRFGFAKMDLLLLCGICICIFLFIRYRFMIPIINLSKAANMIYSGDKEVYVADYKTKELSDLSLGLQSLISKQHKLIDASNKLRFALKQLEVLKQERMEFARHLQHTLRTPIGHIIGGSEVLLSQFKPQLPADSVEYLDMVNKSSRDLLISVNNIISSSNLEAGNIKLDEVNCSIKKVVDDVLAELLPQIGQAKITLQTHINNNLPDVYIDPLWFRTAVFNIVDNSVKFGKENGIINIVAKRTAAGIVLSIEDSGEGMTSAQLHSIEELFEDTSASNNIASTKQGIGLGLTISHHILDLHDATLTIESTEGVGTKVIITIPNIRVK